MNNDILKTIFIDDFNDIEAFEDDVELGLLEIDFLEEVCYAYYR